MRKIALIAFICVAVYALLFRPSKTVKDLDAYIGSIAFSSP